MNDIITQYIDFSIQNGFNYFEYNRFNEHSKYHNNKYDITKTKFLIKGNGMVYFYGEYGVSNCDHYMEIIMSKKFINSVAKGFVKQKITNNHGDSTYRFESELVSCIAFSTKSIFDSVEREITTQQAIAIREDMLDSFINILLK